jgi:putative photosynthetic complex assembly protein
MSTAPRPPEHLPRGLLMALAALVLVSITGVAAVRLSGVEIRSPDAGPVATRSLRFEDRIDGSVAVIDGKTGQEIERVQGEAGFLRGALRALARERRARSGPEAAFELIGRADGRLTLSDPAPASASTSNPLDRPTPAVFARLLTVRPEPGPRPLT